MESTSEIEKHANFSVESESREDSTKCVPAIMSRQNESTLIGEVAFSKILSDSNVNHLSYPAKLHAMLARPDIADVISWLPHGRAWRVHKPKAFERKVIPMFFVQCKYSSFIRQANGWGFRRITKGLDRNAYHHQSFLRGRPELSLSMRRTATSTKVRLNKGEGEPDFYKLSEIDPLPGLCAPSKISLMNNRVVPEFRLKRTPGDQKEIFQQENHSLPNYVEKLPLNDNHLQSDTCLRSFHRANTVPQPYNRHELGTFPVPLEFTKNINKILNEPAERSYNEIVLSNLLLKERLSAGIPFPQNQFSMFPPQVHPDKIIYHPLNLNVVSTETMYQRPPLDRRKYFHEIETLNLSGQNHTAHLSLEAQNTSELIGRAKNALSLNLMHNPMLNTRGNTETNDLKNLSGRLLAALSTHESNNVGTDILFNALT